MKQIIFFIFFIFFEITFSQEQSIDCATTITMNQNVKNFKILKYSEGFFMKKIQNFKNVNNEIPENLLISVLSSSNIDWYNFNREKKAEKTTQNFTYISKVSQKDYYCQLKYRISFEANGIEYAVIKYVLYDNKKEYGFAESMKKIKNRWYTTTDSSVTNLVFFMGMIETKYIDSIFNNLESDNPFLNKMISKCLENNRINLIKILKELQISINKKEKEILPVLDSQRIFK